MVKSDSGLRRNDGTVKPVVIEMLLKFVPTALKEWQKLGDTIKSDFKKALEKRLIKPCIPKQKLSGFQNVYKIKLRSAGYRLVYEVIEHEVVVLVLAVGKRDKNQVYDKAENRR